MGGVAGDLSLRLFSDGSKPLGKAFTSIDSHLVAKTLRGDDGDFIANALVGLEVEGELGVVSLNDDLRGLLDSL